MNKIAIHWFRRDLRCNDNHALYQALRSGFPVVCIFIFDTCILDRLENKMDRRVTFIHQQLVKIQSILRSFGSELIVRHGNPLEVWKQLIATYPIAEVYTNRDYETYGISRDISVQALLRDADITFRSFKDIVVFEKQEVQKDDLSPYTIFTPYSKKWKAKLLIEPLDSYASEELLDKLYQMPSDEILSLDSIGFTENTNYLPALDVDQKIIETYDQTRNFPAIKGTTQLGIHLRFGTVSVRALAKIAWQRNETYLNELIWRDFYQMILSNFPQVQSHSFKKAYDNIVWRNNEDEFAAWCEGRTGYPIVDAGMRELNETGYMHNRVRMIVASFLCKHLLIDWRWGEAYFAAQLNDFELASNNGGWQWAAGCGTDAAPYFRIFSPDEQTKKFDSEKKYIRKWIPELDSLQYPSPIVDHKLARERCLACYKAALAN